MIIALCFDIGVCKKEDRQCYNNDIPLREDEPKKRGLGPILTV